MNIESKPLLESKAKLLDGLDSAVKAHEEGRESDIGDGYDDFDSSLTRTPVVSWNKKENHLYDALHCGLRLWDEWADEANHGWPEFDGIKKEEWKQLGEKLIDELKNDHLPISDDVSKRFPQIEPTRFDRLITKIKSLTSRSIQLR